MVESTVSHQIWRDTIDSRNFGVALFLKKFLFDKYLFV